MDQLLDTNRDSFIKEMAAIDVTLKNVEKNLDNLKIDVKEEIKNTRESFEKTLKAGFADMGDKYAPKAEFVAIKAEFKIVRSLVFGVVTIMLTAIITGLMYLLLRLHQQLN